MSNVLVTGGTGFVGRRVVHALRARGDPVRCLVRSVPGASMLEAWGCELVEGDVTDVQTLVRALDGCEAVVHLVAIIHGRQEDFERVMTRATEDLASGARAAGVRRFVLMGSLGTDAPGAERVPYYRAKQAMEWAVRESGVPHAVLRPSFVFGRDGGALPRFVRIARLAPVVPVPGPGTQRIQPIWVDDVARAVSLALDRADDLLVELGGPDVVTWNELWERISRTLGKRRRLVHVPYRLLEPGAAIAERLPAPPLTRDQLVMLQLADNVVADGGAGMADLGLGDTMPLAEQLERAARRS